MFAQRGQTDFFFRKGSKELHQRGHLDFRGNSIESKDSTVVGDSTEDDRSSLSGKSSDGWLAEDARSPSKETFEPRMPPPPQYYTKVVETKVSANRPADFASAWNAAANVSGWKREEPNIRTKAWKAAAKKSNKKTTTPKATSTDAPLICKATPEAQDDCIQNIPLPKWLSASTPTGPAPHATASLQEPMQMPVPPEGPMAALAYPIIETLVDGSFTFAMGHVKPAQQSRNQVDLPLPGFCQQPLKIFVPCELSDSASMLNMAIPCKKHVPDWGF